VFGQAHHLKGDLEKRPRKEISKRDLHKSLEKTNKRDLQKYQQKRPAKETCRCTCRS